MSKAPRRPELLHVEIAISDRPQPVGTLTWEKGRAFFEYAPSFIASGASISPLHLPLEQRLYEGDRRLFEGLHGVFHDSLPDGWGQVLLDRALRREGADVAALTPLDRLARVGTRGMGALHYRPEYSAPPGEEDIDLERLNAESQKVLAGDSDAVLETLLALNGGSGGVRPKVLVGVSQDHSQLIHGTGKLPVGFDHWMVKFVGRGDPPDIGAIERAYAKMAVDAGIDMMPTELFPGKTGPGFFGVKRFDRVGAGRLHVHSIAGLVNADLGITSISYGTLLNATRAVTKDHRQVEKMFDRMVFNVLAHNRDDHAKNHALLLRGDNWEASPAYDLTFSTGPGGEHSLDLAGNGRTPGRDDILTVAKKAGISATHANQAIEQVATAVARWREFAEEFGVGEENRREIAVRIDRQIVKARPIQVAIAPLAGAPAPPRSALGYLGRAAAATKELAAAEKNGDVEA
jgi:serine/threonine-protein kinase HipA